VSPGTWPGSHPGVARGPSPSPPGPDAAEWGHPGGTEPAPPCPRSPNPRSTGAEAGSGRWQGAAGGVGAALPPAESAGRCGQQPDVVSRQMWSAGRRCGQRCPLTATFKALPPPAHQLAGTGRALDDGREAGCGPAAPSDPRTGLSASARWSPGASAVRPPRGVAPFPGPLCPVAVRGLAVGPSSARAGGSSPRMDPRRRGGPGDVPNPRLSILGPAPHQPPPSCQPSIICHPGRAQHIYPELI